MRSDPAEFTDGWILQRRPPKNNVDPLRPYAHLIEPERTVDGRVEDIATVFLTNKECPFRCLMCDLWKNTTDRRIAVGSIPRQIRSALDQLPPARHLKLYNSGNFFDPQAIPPEDYEEIAAIVGEFKTVVVESHPKLIGRRCLGFHNMIRGDLHVAMGLETVHPDVLARLNKRMTLNDYQNAVAILTEHGMQVRAFILLRPPFLSEDEGVKWAKRSIDFAFESGVECCAVIPTRGGNGAMETLAELGHFAAPRLESLEEVFEYGLSLRRGRVLVDLWDIEKLPASTGGRADRIARLAARNLSQSDAVD